MYSTVPANWAISLSYFLSIPGEKREGVISFPSEIQFCQEFELKLLSLFPKMIIFTNPSARAGYDTRSIFKRTLTGLNSEFSFS